MKMKKFIALGLSLAVTAGTLAGCGGSGNTGSAAGTADTAASDKTADAAATTTQTDAASGASGKVYYLNFKPEQDPQWQDLAKSYTDQTGVPVTVVTAASGELRQLL